MSIEEEKKSSADGGSSSNADISSLTVSSALVGPEANSQNCHRVYEFFKNPYLSMSGQVAEELQESLFQMTPQYTEHRNVLDRLCSSIIRFLKSLDVFWTLIPAEAENYIGQILEIFSARWVVIHDQLPANSTQSKSVKQYELSIIVDQLSEIEHILKQEIENKLQAINLNVDISLFTEFAYISQQFEERLIDDLHINTSNIAEHLESRPFNNRLKEILANFYLCTDVHPTRYVKKHPGIDLYIGRVKHLLHQKLVVYGNASNNQEIRYNLEQGKADLLEAELCVTRSRATYSCIHSRAGKELTFTLYQLPREDFLSPAQTQYFIDIIQNLKASESRARYEVRAGSEPRYNGPLGFHHLPLGNRIYLVRDLNRMANYVHQVADEMAKEFVLNNTQAASLQKELLIKLIGNKYKSTSHIGSCWPGLSGATEVSVVRYLQRSPTDEYQRISYERNSNLIMATSALPAPAHIKKNAQGNFSREDVYLTAQNILQQVQSKLLSYSMYVRKVFGNAYQPRKIELFNIFMDCSSPRDFQTLINPGAVNSHAPELMLEACKWINGRYASGVLGECMPEIGNVNIKLNTWVAFFPIETKHSWKGVFSTNIYRYTSGHTFLLYAVANRIQLFVDGFEHLNFNDIETGEPVDEDEVQELKTRLESVLSFFRQKLLKIHNLREVSSNDIAQLYTLVQNFSQIARFNSHVELKSLITSITFVVNYLYHMNVSLLAKFKNRWRGFNHELAAAAYAKLMCLPFETIICSNNGANVNALVQVNVDAIEDFNRQYRRYPAYNSEADNDILGQILAVKLFQEQHVALHTYIALGRGYAVGPIMDIVHKATREGLFRVNQVFHERGASKNIHVGDFAKSYSLATLEGLPVYKTYHGIVAYLDKVLAEEVPSEYQYTDPFDVIFELVNRQKWLKLGQEREDVENLTYQDLLGCIYPRSTRLIQMIRLAQREEEKSREEIPAYETVQHQIELNEELIAKVIKPELLHYLKVWLIERLQYKPLMTSSSFMSVSLSPEQEAMIDCTGIISYARTHGVESITADNFRNFIVQTENHNQGMEDEIVAALNLPKLHDEISRYLDADLQLNVVHEGQVVPQMVARGDADRSEETSVSNPAFTFREEESLSHGSISTNTRSQLSEATLARPVLELTALRSAQGTAVSSRSQTSTQNSRAEQERLANVRPQAQLRLQLSSNDDLPDTGQFSLTEPSRCNYQLAPYWSTSSDDAGAAFQADENSNVTFKMYHYILNMAHYYAHQNFMSWSIGEIVQKCLKWMSIYFSVGALAFYLNTLNSNHKDTFGARNVWNDNSNWSAGFYMGLVAVGVYLLFPYKVNLQQRCRNQLYVAGCKELARARLGGYQRAHMLDIIAQSNEYNETLRERLMGSLLGINSGLELSTLSYCCSVIAQNFTTSLSCFAALMLFPTLLFTLSPTGALSGVLVGCAIASFWSALALWGFRTFYQPAKEKAHCEDYSYAHAVCTFERLPDAQNQAEQRVMAP